jgi:hypothetical protein
MSFSLLRQHQLYLKLKKCNFATNTLEFLGNIISASGIDTDPIKVQIVQRWTTLICVKDVRSFLGMAGYYRRFVQHFGVISNPLATLLKKGQTFLWADQTQTAFSIFKDAFLSAPVLAIPKKNLNNYWWILMQVRRVLGQFCSKMDIQLHSSVRL